MQKTLSGVLLLILAVAMAAGYWLRFLHPYESTDNCYLKAHISLISPKETGYVSAVLFKDNQKVQAGDLLVVIDDQDFQARVRQAEARLQTEQTHIRTLEADMQTQQSRIRQQRAELVSAEADLKRITKDLQRFGNLAADGAVSEQTRDNTASGHTQAEAQRDKALAEQAEQESGLAALREQINETRARIKVAEAELELARIDLANTRILAPMNGVIGNRNVQQGQLLKPGSILAYLIPDDDLYVEANFKETQLADMRSGQAVDISVDAYPDQRFSGVIDSFSPASGSEFSLLPPENATGNFTKIVRRVPVKIRFQDGSDLSLLKPGLSVLAQVKVR
ncbi:MAG: HlyD family secretion protein [Methylomonas sp.]|jgi:membrane fusion protein (multidrug efflux system)